MEKNEKNVHKKIEEKIENGKSEEKLWYEKSEEKLKKHKKWFEEHDGYRGIETIVCYPIIENKEVRIIYHDLEL